MKKAIKKSVSLLLCFVFVLSCFSAVASARDFSYSADYFFKKTDNQNSSIVLDKIDKILSENFNIKKKLILVRGTILKNEVSINVDFSSVNGLCQTIDLAKSLMSGAAGVVVKPAVGDLAKLNYNTWLTGMSRGAQDYTIINELIEFAANNTDVIGKLLDGSIDLGVVRAGIDLEEILGSGGFGGMLKKLLVGMVYDKETQAVEFEKAYNKALINFDTFIYEDIVREKLNEKLPSFSMDSMSSFDTVIRNAFMIFWKTYIAPKINKLDLDLSDSDNEGLRKLSKILVLNGKEISTTLPIEDGKAFSAQINSAIGYFVKQMIPKYSVWVDGGYEMLGRNITSLCYYLANAAGINTIGKKEDYVAFELLKMFLPLIKETSLEPYFNSVEICRNMKEVEIKILRNYAEINNIPVTKSAYATLSQILGDILADFINGYIDLGYSAGMGFEVWAVLDDFINLILYTNNFSTLFSIKAQRSDSLYAKIDEIVLKAKLFGEITPEKYCAETYLPKIITSIENCDLNTLYGITAVNLFNEFGMKSVAATIYNAVFNFLRSSFGVSVIVPLSSAKPFNNAISNASLKASFNNFVPVLNQKRAEYLPGILKLLAFAMNDKKIEHVNIADQLYIGKSVEPSATVRFNGSVLTPDKDYKITYKDNNKPGVGTAIIIGKGGYSGKTEAQFNIGMTDVTSISAVSTSEGIKVEWIPVPGADSYQVYLDNKLITSTDLTSTLIEDYEGSTVYTVKVRAVSDYIGPTDFKEVSVMTVPGKVNNLSARSGFSGVILSWEPSKGATGYEIEQLSGGTWKKLAFVSDTKYTVKTAKIGDSCTFRVRATGNTTFALGPYSEAASVIFNPRMENVENITYTSASTMITLFWQGVDGADEYEIFVNNNSRPSTYATSTVLTGLEPGKQYNVKIRAVNHSMGASGFTETTVATIPESVGTLTYDQSGKEVTVYWKAARGAERYEVYIDNTFKESTNSTFCKLSDLKLGKSYVVSVRAVNSSCGASALSLLSIPMLPTKVSKLSATSSGSKAILSWSAAEGATSYEIDMKSGSKWKKVTSVASLSYTVNSLESGTTYSFRVRANSPAGHGAYSPVATATAALSKVSTLMATAITEKSLKLTWDKIKNADGYIVEKKVGNQWKVIKKTTTNKLTVDSLSANTSYSFRVKAFIDKSYGEYSQTLTVKTLISAPKNLKAKTIDSKKVTLTWSKVSGAKGYVVYVNSGAGWKKAGSASKTSMTVSGLKAKTDYKFRIRAYDSSKNYGGYSKALSVKTK